MPSSFLAHSEVSGRAAWRPLPAGVLPPPEGQSSAAKTDPTWLAILVLSAGFLCLLAVRRARRRQARMNGKGHHRAARVPTPPCSEVDTVAGLSPKEKQAQEAKRSSFSPSLALLAAAVYASNIGANLLNKQMLDDFAGCPLSACTLIFGFGSVISLAAWWLGLQRPPKEMNMKLLSLLAPVVILQCLTAIFTQLAISRLSLSLFHTIRATEPLLTALMSLVVFQMVPAFRVIVSLALIFFGVVLSSTAEVSFNWTGFIFAIGSNVFFVMKNVLAKKALKTGEVDGANLIALLTIGSFAVSLPAAILWEGVSFPAAVVAAQGPLDQHLWRFLGAGSLFHLYQMCSMMVLSRFPPVTHSVVNCMKRPMLVVASVVFFNTSIRWQNGLGIIFALLGVNMYSRISK